MYLYLIIIVLIIIGWFLALIDRRDSNFHYCYIGWIVGVIIPTVLFFYIASMPSAMDVYRGKTTLEITYKDSVAIDSVVVFKENLPLIQKKIEL